MPAAAALLLAAALGRALGAELLGGCSAAERQSVLRSAGVSTLGTVGGRRVVLASVHGSCICGNVNCPYVVLRLGPGGKADVLLNTFAFDVSPVGPAAPLPNLHELAHDSALITDETVDAYRNGTYVPIATSRVRGDTGARKANAVPVHFAPGTSAAQLHGSVSFGWYDEYALPAAAGQRLAVSGAQSPGQLTFRVVSPHDDRTVDLLPGEVTVLPKAGTYLLQIDGAGDSLQRYRATVTIR